VSAGNVPGWDGQDLGELLDLEAVGPMRFRNRLGDANAHDRAYGGQILGQALLAAARTVPAGRAFATMQFLFLQGTLHAQPIDFAVEALQDGKRFSSRHVRGTQQGGRAVLDAQLSFAVPIDAPAHEVAPVPAFADEDPERLPTVAELPAAWSEELERACGYRFWVKEAIDFRFASPPAGLRLDAHEPRLRYWIRLRHRLGDDPHLHAAAFAYLTDWWFNYPSLGAHVQPLLDAGRRLYVASLNHAIWQHRPLRADAWLHFDLTSPSAAAGRSLTIARVHDRAGRLVASATQESLMAPREG
jgi:acyl-CoA thioesterase-2